jgi:hypothetical protein
MMSKKVLITLLLCCLSFAYISLVFAVKNYNFYRFYKTAEKEHKFLPTFQKIDKMASELDFSKALLKRGHIQDSHSINVSLSSQDLITFRDFYFDSLTSTNYLADNNNEWRKVTVHLPNMGKVKAKIKIHGTSITPISLSIGYLNQKVLRAKNKILGSNEGYPKSFIDITNGGYAFKLKLRNDLAYNGKSRLNFLAPRDDWAISGNAINKFIASFGVITTHGNYYNLFVNGNDIGLYLVTEKIDKNLLERNFQITNYSILKNYDDWDKAWGPGHSSPTMFTSYDMEQSGDLRTQKIALSQIQRLFKAISVSDYETIKALVDVGYLAKVYALSILTGDFHPLTGDNSRYIYDFSSGLFKIAYRIEGRPQKVRYSALDSKIKLEINYGPHALINELAATEWFRTSTLSYLKEISNDSNLIIDLIDNEYKLFKVVEGKSKYPANHYKFDYFEDLNTVSSNLELINNIVTNNLTFELDGKLLENPREINTSYAKVFMSVMKNTDNRYQLDLLNDSLSNLTLLSIISCDGAEFKFDPEIKIKPAAYDKTSGLIRDNYNLEVEVPFPCINSANIFNKVTKLPIKPEHIYINYAESFSVFKNKGLRQFGSKLKREFDSEADYWEYTLKEGDYSIFDDVIFPKGAKVTFEPGVNLNISEGVTVFIRGDFSGQGTKSQPIAVKNLSPKPFGSFAIKGTSVNRSQVKIEHFYIQGGSEAIIDGTYFSSQLSIHLANVLIRKSLIANSSSDDGMNIKNSRVEIVDNEFKNNFSDQLDLDFVYGNVVRNTFNVTNNLNGTTDGLDISGSTLAIIDNKVSNMTDKGLSIGENSKANIYNNIIQDNNIGIAVKDGSKVCLKHNVLSLNSNNLSLYIKKNMYEMPVLFIDNQELDINDLLYKTCKIENFLELSL